MKKVPICKYKNISQNIKSQFNQDIVMYFKHFANIKKGVFIELGAYDGVTISNTYFFEKNYDWNGILIEGGVMNCRRLFANSNKRLNSKLVCSPICKSEYVSFRDSDSGGSLDHNQNSKNRIKCNTLSNITHFFNIKHIDFFSLDVEGSELEVIQTFDFNVTVSYWLIEWNHLSQLNKDGIVNILYKNGYIFAKEYISEIDALFKHV